MWEFLFLLFSVKNLSHQKIKKLAEKQPSYKGSLKDVRVGRLGS